MALNAPKSDRDLLGGCSAQQGDRYSRASKEPDRPRPKAFLLSSTDKVDQDPLAELETLEDFTLLPV